jgi:hypothetical protein
VRDVTAAMLSIDDTLSDLLYDQERMLLHEIEDLTPVRPASDRSKAKG